MACAAASRPPPCTAPAPCRRLPANGHELAHRCCFVAGRQPSSNLPATPSPPPLQPPLPRRQLLLKVAGQPALRLPLPAAGVCLAPLAARRAGAATGATFEPLLLTEAAGAWDLPGLDPMQRHTLHLVYAAADGVPDAPPLVLGVGALALAPSCGTATPADPIPCQALSACCLACPASGVETAQLVLAARLAPLPLPPSPSKAASPSKGSPRRHPRPAMRSAAVQAGPAAAPPAQAPPAWPPLSPPYGPPPPWPWAACPPWPQLAAAPPACWPAPAAPPAWPACGPPPGLVALGVPVAAAPLQGWPHSPAWQPPMRAGPVEQLQSPQRSADPAAPPPPSDDSLAPRLAAIRTRMQQERSAAGAADTCTLRSPLEAAGVAAAPAPPPLEHHLRETRHRSPVRRHEAMVRSALARPSSAAAGAFSCPGCLAPLLRPPGSPSKRRPVSAGAAARQQCPACHQCCPVAASVERGAPAAPITALPPSAAGLEELLQRLGLNCSGWHDALLAGDSAGEPAAPLRRCSMPDGAAGALPAAQSSAVASQVDAPHQQAPAAKLRVMPAQPGGKPVKLPSEPQPASPLITARRRSSMDSGGSGGSRQAVAAPLPSPVDTVRLVASRSRELIQRQLAAPATQDPPGLAGAPHEHCLGWSNGPQPAAVGGEAAGSGAAAAEARAVRQVELSSGSGGSGGGGSLQSSEEEPVDSPAEEPAAAEDAYSCDWESASGSSGSSWGGR